MDNFWNILAGIDGGRILDIACGRGQFVKVLIDNLGAFSHITGLDVNQQVLEEAAENFKADNIIFLAGTSQNIIFPDESFDTVSLSKGLHHLEDHRLGLHEMMRVLKVGGLLMINEMYSDGLSPSQLSHMQHHHLRVDIDNLLGISHKYTFTRDHILELVDELGLHDVSVYDYSEDAGPPDSPEIINEYLDKMKGWKGEVAGFPEEKKILAAIEKLKSRFKEHGISRPPQLVIMGYK